MTIHAVSLHGFLDFTSHPVLGRIPNSNLDAALMYPAAPPLVALMAA